MRRDKTIVLGTLLAWLLGGSAALLADPVGLFDDAADIGGPPVDGSTTFDGVQYTLQGAGADIGDGGDQFHFAYKRVSGDFTATIRVSSRSTTPAGSGTLGRYGLMVRWSLEANAKYSLIANVLPTEDVPLGAFPSFYEFRMFDREDVGNRINYSASDDTFPTEGRSPSWMRIVRRGPAIYGYLSEDAEQDGTPDRWTLIGSDSAGYLPDVLLVGVALCSQADDNLGTIVFDSAAIETAPVEAPLACTAGDTVAQIDFASGFGVPPGQVRVAAPISPYSPRVTGGRLRLSQDGVPSTGTAVWYDLPGSESLAATGFVAEFDLFMTKPGLFDAINPADGMTFAVVDGGAEILGACPDRTEPRVQRFSSTALVSRGLGCVPATVTSTIRDLIPTQISTNAVRSEGDIWADGDTFLYQYQQVSGDFDISIEMTSYAHSTGQGDWGKFGLMARQNLDTRSRYTMMQSIGPGAGFPARQSMRTVHLSEGDTSEFVLPNIGARPRFQRLTRRGSVFQGWASDNPGLGDGSLNPSNDCNWIPGTPDDWGDAPASVLVGFANSNHASAGCATQTIQYRGLPASSAKSIRPSDLVGLSGGNLGYGGGTLRARTTGHPSLAVEVDTWTSPGQGEPGNDPPGFGSPNFDGRRHHFGLDIDAEVSSIQTSADYGLPLGVLPSFLASTDPAGVHVTVSYAPDGRVDVSSRSNASPSNGYEVLSTRVPALAGTLLFGFTAGAGDATATFEVDNFALRSRTCVPQPTSTLAAVVIDLGNVTGGGDGSHDSLSPYLGVDPRTGNFVDSYFTGRLNDTDAVPLAPSSPSQYIDSVFYLSSGAGGDHKVPAITQSGVKYTFAPSEATGSTWNYILKDRNGGVSTPGITVGPLTGFTTSVGIHAAAGITYNLDALRERHGARSVQCFSTTWGLDNCATGDVTLYAIVSDDAGSIATRSFRATSGSWDILRMPIPDRAKYLSLATAANGNDNCDHGTFARPVITSMPCPSYSSFSWIWSVLPSLVSTEGGNDVAFFGEFLGDGDTLRAGGVDLTDFVYFSENFVTGRMPALPPGLYDAQIYNSDGGVSASLPRAIEVAPPLGLLAVEPRDVFLDVETPVVVRGANFRSQTRVWVAIYPGGDPFPLIDPVFVSETEIQGRVPMLPAGEPSGFREVYVEDGRGKASLQEGVQFVDLSSVQLTSVDPPVVSTQGGTRVTFGGSGFAAGLVAPYLGGQPLSDVVFLGENELEGTSPELPAGFHDAELLRPAGDVVASLASAVEARTLDPNDVHLVSVSPAQVSTLGGDRVTFGGSGFVEGLMTPRIAGEPLLDVTFLSDAQLQGTTPSLPAGLLDADLRGSAGEILVTLPGAVQAVAPAISAIASVAPSSIPDGQRSELVFEGEGFRPDLTPRLSGVPLLGATYVDAAHFQGFAPDLPLGFHDADLADANGAVVAALSGAVEVVPAQEESNLAAPAEIDAVYAEGQARFIWSNPMVYDKIRATEILSTGGVGRIFELAGGSTSLLIPATRAGVALELKGFLHDRISAGSLTYAYPADCGQPTPLGGYGIVGKLDFPLFGGNLLRLPGRCVQAPRAPVNGLGGGGGAFDLVSEWASINGFEQAIEGYGVTARDRTLNAVLATFGPHCYSNRLVTGFTLEADADRLQIEGFYQKIGEAPGLALVGRLVHIYPDDGFEDEFTLPDAAPGEDPDWHGLTYFRANRDVAEAEAQTCNLKIPKGDYILQLYAINGEPDQSYYLFRDDGRDIELLVPGAPCPPYPLVRIRDVSGKRTLPNISDIKAREVGPLQIELRATGNWFDGVSTFPHSIDPADASYVAHNFEFFWTIESSAVAGTKSSGSSNRIVVPVKAIGCYRVHLNIRDRACDRAVTTTREAIVTPTKFLCSVSPYVVQNPTPDPAGIIAVAGLDPGPGQGRMSKRRELSLRVLISSESLCGGDARILAPDAGDLEFRLVWSYFNLLVFPPVPEIQVAVPPAEILSTNLCRSVPGSPYTYFELLIRELGRARPLPIWADNGNLVPVKLQWRTLRKRVRTALGGVTAVTINNDPWHDVSPSIRMTNAPLSLGKNNWQGSFSPPGQTYRFVHQASEHYQSDFALGRTPPVPVGIIPGVKIPPMDNNFGGGLNTEIQLVNGVWVAGTAKVDEGGEILSNKIRGGTLQIESSGSGGGAALEGGAIREGLRSQTTYSWCKQQEIFNKTSEQELFNAVIFATVVPPGIPVTVWASVGLALKVAITAQAGVVISLFDALEGGSFVKSDVYFKSELGLHIPASIHADVLFGVVSVVFKLIPQVNAVFGVHVGNRDLDLVKEANLSIFLRLSMQLKLCFLSFLNDLIGDALCFGPPPQQLISSQLIDFGDPIVYEDCPEAGDGGNALDGGAVLPPADGGGAGSDLVISLEEFLPATKASRDGKVAIDVAYEKSDNIYAPRTRISVKIGDGPRKLFSSRLFWELDPSIGFLSNKRALIAWTRSFAQDAIDAGAVVHPDNNYTNDELNFFRAHDEIIITPASETAPNFWDVSPDFIISDPRAEVPDPAARRVDGRPSVAGDETHGDALVAWVRIDDPEYYFLDPGTNQTRVHLEKASIFARAVGFNGVLDVPQQVSTGGINIEPSVTFSPSGNVAYCVWVNDPNHLDLVGSNRGRNLVYSVYQRSTNLWSAPQPIVADPDSYPGMLEPSISLKRDDYGLLAFTALDASADEKDTGILGANRYVFISRLVDGVFGPPMRVHGKCEKRVFGSKVVIEIPKQAQDPLERVLKKWEWQVFYQSAGPAMSLEGAGGLMTSGLPEGALDPTPAVAVLADGNIRSNLAATMTSTGIQVVSLNLGPSLRRVAVGAGAGGGIDPPPQGVFETTDIPVLPDLSIASCALSNQFAGPGARVTLNVKIENDGLVGSASTGAGQSLVGLEVLYLDATGAQRLVATSEVPVIEAGTSAELALILEQPLDPVRLVVALSPNPFDSNPLNDSVERFLGTPEPLHFVCESIPLGDDPPTTGVQLTWTNALSYEEIFLYRDGGMLAAIPGGSTTYVDREPGAGSHTYEIRSRVEVSKSRRVPCDAPGSTGTIFRRGDADSNGRLELTDAVVTLGFLFLGTRAPACFDAADADDSGKLAITDPIRTLNYLFLGGPAPPAPGPTVCGEDPTSDTLGCEKESTGC